MQLLLTRSPWELRWGTRCLDHELCPGWCWAAQPHVSMATAPSEHLQLEPPAPARISVRGAGGSSPRGDLHFKPAGEPSREPADSILSHKAFLLISACFSKYCAWCERNVLPGGQPRANTPPCREGGGAGCCLRSENSQSWIPCLWLKIGAAGSGRQAGAQGHLLQRR